MSTDQQTLDGHQDDGDVVEGELVDETEATDHPQSDSPDGCDVADGQEPEPDTGTSVVAVPVSGPAVVQTFTETDVAVIKETIGADMSDAQLHLFLSHAKNVGLDPMSKQIYGWVDGGKLVTMVSIDGLRLVRERTGKYLGPVGPQWCGPDGRWLLDENGDAMPWLDRDNPPAAARFGVRHRDHEGITWGIATWAQYGKNKGLWRKDKGGGPHMLAKCSEAIASRMAFPQELGGVYTNDEIPEAVQIEREGGGSGKRRGNGGKRAAMAEPLESGVVEAAMMLFQGLPEDGRAKVEERWAARLESWNPDAGATPGAVDDGGLFIAPAGWVEPFIGLIEKAAEHYGTAPDDDDVVEAEIVDEGTGQ